MKTPIGNMVLDLVIFTFGGVESCLNFASKFLPGFICRPMFDTFNGTKDFSLAMLEASDTRFQILSNFVEEHFPSFHEWLVVKTQKVSNIAVENTAALQLQQERASLYLSTAFNTWRRRVLSASHAVKVNVHPLVHTVAVNSSPVLDSAKRMVSPAVDLLEPVWRPVIERAIAVNESIKRNQYVGMFNFISKCCRFVSFFLVISRLISWDVLSISIPLSTLSPQVTSCSRPRPACRT